MHRCSRFDSPRKNDEGFMPRFLYRNVKKEIIERFFVSVSLLINQLEKYGGRKFEKDSYGNYVTKNNFSIEYGLDEVISDAIADPIGDMGIV